ncbi:MAG: phosphopyruvate hydratase [Candidatus Doudnabacteria bacterium RIFCSPHIGHO2_01_FULL_50_11]|uniref:Enolase n=1 Tax=Candidatus Doudnabacteria bacterium RIFCSPHIGHO2_01_FULL_50_11 TaxID=1817828 RepID=A0A1F5PNG9_9BACT|nr:MAG: phosphopyruvate hydratase [Candidatus Doudnabacteria bacterium RIFCSPHIGHO2_01_FULL_50_11]HLC44640.1 phosphopyruvate hydratase [Patescibacteria group bacterium]
MALKSAKIKSLHALEILDSRGIPTLEVSVVLYDGTVGCASVPAGTSSGSHEAYELRDHDEKRYRGQGMMRAIESVEKKIFRHVEGMVVDSQQEIDKAIVSADPDPQKSHIGSNAALGVSLACARAAATVSGLPLYRYIREAYQMPDTRYRLPQPMFNLLNGGAHADSGMDIQEFMLVPQAASFAESVRWAAETFAELKDILASRGLAVGVGLEGGFSPGLSGNREALNVLAQAIQRVSLPADSARIALDVAATLLTRGGQAGEYFFKREKASFSRDQLIAWYAELAKTYPILSIEDGLGEDDWAGWQILCKRLRDTILVVGDDLTVTSTQRLQKAIDTQAISALIIKPNQVGTLSQTIACAQLAHQHGIKRIVSHRSGDTPDTFIADLAVALGAEYIKAGSVTRGERVAKYNRLLQIEKELSI